MSAVAVTLVVFMALLIQVVMIVMFANLCSDVKAIRKALERRPAVPPMPPPGPYYGP
jgi:hypothetical protein